MKQQNNLSTRPARQYINPVLVKELRQGVRSKLYTIVFLAIQVVMLMYLLLLTASHEARASDEFEGLFWALISMFLLVCLPLTGANALNTENRGSRLELLLLTGLSSRRIVFGKWLAIVSQGALLVTALLPYLVLRYYIDSSEFHESLAYILLLLVASAVLTGITVCLSVIRTAILRWFLLVFGGMFVLMPAIINLLMQFYSLQSIYADLPALILCGLLLIALCMEFAATRFNPIEENHDTAKRLLLWAMFGISLYNHFTSPALKLPYIAMLVCFAIIAADGLCRAPSTSPTIYEPFVRFGRLGRIAGRLFYPGWPSAVRFSLLTLIMVSIVPIMEQRNIWHNESWLSLWRVLLIIGVYLFPFALVICMPFAKKRLGLSLFLCQLVLVLLTTLLNLVDKATGLHTTVAISWIPTCALLLDMMNNILTPYSLSLKDPSASMLLLQNTALIGTTVATLFALVVVFIKQLGQERIIRRMEALAESNLRMRKGSKAQASPQIDAPLPAPSNETAS